MRLRKKLHVYRNLDEKVTIESCYPDDLDGKIKYLNGLLQAMISIGINAINKGSNLIQNNVLCQTMHNMKLSKESCEKVINDFIQTQALNNDEKIRFSQNLIFIADYENMAMAWFEYLGLLEERMNVEQCVIWNYKFLELTTYKF